MHGGISEGLRICGVSTQSFIERSVDSLHTANFRYFSRFVVGLPTSTRRFLGMFPQLTRRKFFSAITLRQVAVRYCIFYGSKRSPLRGVRTKLNCGVSQGDNYNYQEIQSMTPGGRVFYISFGLPDSVLSNVPARTGHTGVR